jgi:hypothetical protein
VLFPWNAVSDAKPEPKPAPKERRDPLKLARYYQSLLERVPDFGLRTPVDVTAVDWRNCASARRSGGRAQSPVALWLDAMLSYLNMVESSSGGLLERPGVGTT